MKYIGLLVILAILSTACNSQGLFSQKTGQIKNLIRQVAALHVYIDYLEQGYAIAKKGLSTIGDIKRGDAKLHTDYFASLTAINPNLKQYARLPESLVISQEIASCCKQLVKLANEKRVFSIGESQYINNIQHGLLEKVSIVMDELLLLITPGNYAFKDNERIDRLNLEQHLLLEAYRFAKEFTTSISLLVLQKEKENSNVLNSRLLYGLQN